MSIDEEEYAALTRWRLLQAEKIMPVVKDAIVPVWTECSNGMRRLIGTAFFAERNARSFLVTALHIFTNNPGAVLKIELSGVTWTLNGMFARVSAEDDLWIAEACVDLHNLLRNIRTPLLERDDPEDCRYGAGSVLVGYPVALTSPDEEFQVLPISTHLEIRGLTSETELPEPLFFNVEGDSLYSACGEAVIDLPEMFGMSGGPVFSWNLTPIEGTDSWGLHFFLQGVTIGWARCNGYLVACNAARIVALLEGP